MVGQQPNSVFREVLTECIEFFGVMKNIPDEFFPDRIVLAHAIFP